MCERRSYGVVLSGKCLTTFQHDILSLTILRHSVNNHSVGICVVLEYTDRCYRSITERRLVIRC